MSATLAFNNILNRINEMYAAPFNTPLSMGTAEFKHPYDFFKTETSPIFLTRSHYGGSFCFADVGREISSLLRENGISPKQVWLVDQARIPHKRKGPFADLEMKGEDLFFCPGNLYRIRELLESVAFILGLPAEELAASLATESQKSTSEEVVA